MGFTRKLLSSLKKASTPMMLPDIFHRYRNQIDIELSSILDGYQLPLYDMLRYHLGYLDIHGNPSNHSNGKALRSTLCLMACEAVGGDFHRTLPAAAALELVHNFSLIHDDIQDGDRERRHRPTVWAIHGKPQAINAGMAMRVLANVSMMRLNERGVPSSTLLQALALLDQTSLRLIEGQYLDLSFEQRQDISTEDYLNMVKLKTVSLIACALELGAMLVVDDRCLIQPLLNFGTNLGFAFQLRDDLLGIWGDQSITGKPVGSDILRRKKSYPVVFAWENSSDSEKNTLSSLYQDDRLEEDGKSRVLEILDGTGARNHSQALIEKYCQDARLEIEQAQVSATGRACFTELIEFLSIREF
ncbi:MAG: hypothetical protein A2Z16_10130 [Chloroflexi bacterium RBG_16_54_18]|nr:MAG: hypothetical protein A2Z16_10130 [Chloroflexi bacterium RBG_16_54_18]